MGDITAATLYRKSNNAQINTIIDEHYKTIARNIHAAQLAGRAEVIYDLPDTFEVGALNPADIQIKVYSELIEKIEQNNLKIELIRSKKTNTSKFRIFWPTMMDPVEMKRMKNIILSHIREEE